MASLSHNDILQLPSLRAETVEDNGDHYRIRASGQFLPGICPQCRSFELVGHVRQLQQFLDVPIHGKRTLLEIKRQRFRCKRCNKTLLNTLGDMDAKRLCTSRLVTYIESRYLKKTFAELAREVGVDEKTIRHIFDAYIARLQSEVKFENPEIMGIDELKIIGQYRAMITNVEHLALYDMLPTRKKADLIAYFKQLPDKHRIKVITMVLWNVYRQVIEDQFPGRMIVADRFHVLRMANEAVEKTRKAVRRQLDTRTRLRLKDDRFLLLARWHSLSTAQQNKLEEWAEQFPNIGAAYRTKEAFHEFYEHSCREDAEQAAREWLQAIPPTVSGNFRETAHALTNWWSEIFNWYDCKITNGYTESINRIAKDMNRMGRGYSLEVIRARLLYDDEARRPKQKTIRTKKRVAKPTVGFMKAASMKQQLPTTYETQLEVKVIEYGPHIPTLCDLLESGHFE